MQIIEMGGDRGHPETAARATQAMLQMRKVDGDGPRQAYEGRSSLSA